MDKNGKWGKKRSLGQGKIKDNSEAIWSEEEEVRAGDKGMARRQVCPRSWTFEPRFLRALTP